MTNKGSIWIPIKKQTTITGTIYTLDGGLFVGWYL
jgi:hypothetical protein